MPRRRLRRKGAQVTALGKGVDVGCWPDSSGPFHRRRFVGQCQKLTNAVQQSCDDLFDYLVGERLYRVRHLDAECPGRLQVDDELELGRLRDWQVGRFLALEDAVGVATAAPLNCGPD
jgi:hypothetical protein